MRHAFPLALLVLLVPAACTRPGTPEPAAAPATQTSGASTEASTTQSAESGEPSAVVPAEASAEAAAEEPLPSGETCAEAIPIAIDAGESAIVQGSMVGRVNDFDGMVPRLGASYPGPDVFYRIEMNAGDSIQIGLHDNNTFDSAVWSFADCAAPGESVLDGFDSSDEAFLPAEAVDRDGTYYVAVDSVRGAPDGEFTLLVIRRDAEGNDVPVVTTDDCASAPVAALPIVTNVLLEGSRNNVDGQIPGIADPVNGVDRFLAFETTEPGSVRINVLDEELVNSAWYVFRDCANVAGSTLVAVDSGDHARMTRVTLPEAGRYYLGLDALEEGSTGSVSVTMY